MPSAGGPNGNGSAHPLSTGPSSYLGAMRLPLSLLLALLILGGCASEKRLGEAKFQPRRHSRGVYVQQHAAFKTEKGDMPASSVHAPADLRSATDEGPEPGVWTALDGEAVHTEVAVVSLRRPDPPALAGSIGAEGRPRPLARRPVHSVPPAGRSTVHLLEGEGVPPPIDGFHPNAVPGFVLSLGWIIGGVAAIALSTAAAPLAGLAFFVGCLASILGHFVSKRAFRMSRKHPELYPRFKLPRAARILSLLWLYAALVYIAVVLLVLLLLAPF